MFDFSTLLHPSQVCSFPMSLPFNSPAMDLPKGQVNEVPLDALSNGSHGEQMESPDKKQMRES